MLIIIEGFLILFSIRAAINLGKRPIFVFQNSKARQQYFSLKFKALLLWCRLRLAKEISVDEKTLLMG
jgi:hypothetical protein